MGNLFTAYFDLTKEEADHLEKMLLECNRTLDNLIQTLLKKTIQVDKNGGFSVDLSELGLRWKGLDGKVAKVSKTKTENL